MIKKILFIFILFNLIIFSSFAYTIIIKTIYGTIETYKDVISYHIDDYYLKLQLTEDNKKIIINRHYILFFEVED